MSILQFIVSNNVNGRSKLSWWPYICFFLMTKFDFPIMYWWLRWYLHSYFAFIFALLLPTWLRVDKASHTKVRVGLNPVGRIKIYMKTASPSWPHNSLWYGSWSSWHPGIIPPPCIHYIPSSVDSIQSHTPVLVMG